MDVAEGREYAGRYFSFLDPRNIIAEWNSAVHYNSSPYTYVLNNPLSYIDPLGPDTTKVNQLKEVSITGNKGVNPWAPSLILLGQPLKFLKPVGALGSEPGSSVASWGYQKFLQVQLFLQKLQPEKRLLRLSGKKVATKVVNKVLGAAVVGRL